MTGRTAGAEAAPITAAGSRSVAFGEAWKFALVNPDGITDPTGRTPMPRTLAMTTRTGEQWTFRTTGASS